MLPYDRWMAKLPGLPSRHQRQQQTRAALVEAAREAFAELGYHGANLERIAHKAGFSKGAVYSNFDGKAALFLAVMDANLQTVWSDPWTPVSGSAPPSLQDLEEDIDEEELEELIRGFALATLEFIAVAARDPELRGPLQQRIQDVVNEYAKVAREFQAGREDLNPEQLGTLLTALDQGSGLMLLGGSTLDDDLLGLGMSRLLSPGADETGSKDGDDGGGPDQGGAETGGAPRANSHVQQRLMKAMRAKKSRDSKQ